MELSRIFTLFILMGCTSSHAQNTFRNPILDEPAHDPSIIKFQDSYFMVFNQDNRIELLKRPILSNFRNAERHEIYRDDSQGVNLIVPRIHSILGELYIYFSKMTDTDDETSRRLFVIKCLDPREPFGEWSTETRILPEEEFIAVHGTVLQYNNRDMHFIWDGRRENGEVPFGLYIARMENPFKVVSPRTLLRSPKMDWENQTEPSNEAPFIMQNQGRTLLGFSASVHISQDYCLGVMGIDGGRDPMLISYWFDDMDQCVFARDDGESVWAPGHASVIQSPDDTEMWMLYDAWDQSDNGYVNRTARIQKIEWEMNTPEFPRVLGTHRELIVPSGE